VSAARGWHGFRSGENTNEVAGFEETKKKRHSFGGLSGRQLAVGQIQAKSVEYSSGRRRPTEDPKEADQGFTAAASFPLLPNPFARSSRQLDSPRQLLSRSRSLANKQPCPGLIEPEAY
jgi:hypothetical protein